MVENTFFSDTLKIQAPKEYIFDFLMDFSERGRWIEGLEVEEITPAREGKVGTVIREVIHIFGHRWECTTTITEVRDNEYLKMKLEDDKENIIIDYTLTGEKGHTLLTETATIVEGSTIHRLITGQERHTLDKRLHKLKEVVEEDYLKSR